MSPDVPLFLRVTVGSAVYTSDVQRIGKVKDKRGPYFKVETGLLQRDYWLSADVVSSAIPGDSVTLSVDKGHLGEQRIYKDPTLPA